MRWHVWRLPALVSVGVAAGALFPQAALRDVATLLPPGDVGLRAPLAYVVLAPLCGVLDAVSLFGRRQHWAFAATVAIGVVAWRLARGDRARLRREIAVVCGSIVGGVLGTYAVCTLVPRPMLALASVDPDLVAVDFHSHTSFSRDGRAGFTVERNRAWHRAGGWDVAYIADHSTLAGADQGVAANPDRAGDGTILLAAIECRSDGTHFVVLGPTPEDRERFGRGQEWVGNSGRHVVIQTIPARMEKIARLVRPRVGPLVGIEVADGDPRGIEQAQRHRAGLLAIADRRNLALIAASNNHGWSFTPAAWSLLRIAGWRELAPPALDERIQDRLRQDGRRAVRVVERHGVDAGPTTLSLAATVPAAGWRMFATLTGGQRVSWLVWAWGGALLWASRARVRAGSVDGEGADQA